MSSGGAAAVPFPIRFADIVFANIPDPNGQNPKIRRVVVLIPDLALAAGSPIVVAAVTGTLPNPLTADYVKLPYKNPPGRHPKTGLTKEAAVLCTWIVPITTHDIHGRSGFVPPAYMAIVNSKTAAAAKAIGRWS
jgi:mRNA-degrading endonuclease toxin of MazEF toxin-antitoxin module